MKHTREDDFNLIESLRMGWGWECGCGDHEINCNEDCCPEDEDGMAEWFCMKDEMTALVKRLGIDLDWYIAKVNKVGANPTRSLPQTELTEKEAHEYIADTGYWNVDEELAARHGVEDQLKEYKRLRGYRDEVAKKYLDSNSVLKTKVIGQVDHERQIKRLTNPDLDGLLHKYGYIKVGANG